MNVRTLFVLALLSMVALAAAPASRSASIQIREGVRPVPKFSGALVLAGNGKMLPCVPLTFLHLAGGTAAPIAVVHTSGKPDLKTWTKLGATGAKELRLKSEKELRTDEVLTALTGARGIWLDDDAAAFHGDPLLRVLLQSALERGAVIGGKGAAAQALASAWVDKKGEVTVGGFGLLRDSLIDVGYQDSRESQLREALESNRGYLGWGIPASSSLVIHHGREIGAMGKGSVAVMVAAYDDWPMQMDGINAIDAFDPGQVAPNSLDLLAWQRLAEVRRDPMAFPPKEAKVPNVPKGTLILQGGGGVNDATWDRFIKAAGGKKKARFVCLPGAGSIDPGEEPDSYSAGELRERGCKNVTTLHTSDPRRADSDAVFKEALENATGVWIDGGRTYRFMDCYQYTEVHRLLFEVLKNGGVVGGSSAGCQVLGDFLVRGNPRSNKNIYFDAYGTGLGLIEGVILDAHFIEREREAEFEGLMERFPQMLGIGVDSGTALLVRGSMGEVLGENGVVFYDYADGTPDGSEGEKGLVVKSGQKYDLAKRKLK